MRSDVPMWATREHPEHEFSLILILSHGLLNVIDPAPTMVPREYSVAGLS